jgi:hypothetical protein
VTTDRPVFSEGVIDPFIIVSKSGLFGLQSRKISVLERSDLKKSFFWIF